MNIYFGLICSCSQCPVLLHVRDNGRCTPQQQQPKHFVEVKYWDRPAIKGFAEINRRRIILHHRWFRSPTVVCSVSVCDVVASAVAALEVVIAGA